MPVALLPDVLTGSQLEFALRLTAATGTLLTAFLLTLALLRTYQYLARHRRAHEIDKWEEILSGSVRAVRADVSALPTERAFAFVHAWNEAFERVRIGEAGRSGREHLHRVASLAALPEASLALLHAQTKPAAFSATKCLGYLRAAEAWDDLFELSTRPDPYLSLAAFRALFRIDATRAAPHFAAALPLHPDWPEHALSDLFREADASVQASLVADARHRLDPATSARLFRALDDLGHDEATALLAWHLRQAKTEADVQAFLHVALRETHVDLILDHLHAGRRAAAALARGDERVTPTHLPPWVRLAASRMDDASDDPHP